MGPLSTMADPFPLYVPPEARRLFQSESLLRRFAQIARWDEGSALLELHGTQGGVALAKALECHLTILEPDAKLAETLKARAKALDADDKVAVQVGAIGGFKFADRAFDGIFSFGRVTGLAAQVGKTWRPQLAVNGRLGITAVVRVGRTPHEAVLEAWKARLGAAPLSPRETLMSLEAEGFEPEHIESLGEVELDEYYKELEAALARTADTDAEGARALNDEIALHKKYKTKAGISLGFIIARRKEPGERPPASRDGG